MYLVKKKHPQEHVRSIRMATFRLHLSDQAKTILENTVNKRVRTVLTMVTFLLITMGCNHPKEVDSSSETKQVDSTEISVHADTLIQINEISASFDIDTLSESKETDNKKQVKKREIFVPLDRYMEYPGDAHFNGKPMTQQEEIPQRILEKHPDTLSTLAIARYKTYDRFFPKSISDNFEEMKSTEHIHYPDVLIFRFELFENENAIKPYHVEEVKVKRHSDGELYTKN